MSFEEKGAFITLLCLMHQKGRLSETQIKKFIGDYWEDISFNFILDENGLYYNKRLEEESNKRKKYIESRSKARLKSDEDNVRIYLILDNKRGNYKIGSSVNPMRRFSELMNQKSPAIMLDTQGSRDIKLIWYSEPILRSVEGELHKKFSAKRIQGEWYNFNSSDIQLIKEYVCNTYESTYEPRTENEIENEDISIVSNNKGGFKKPTLEQVTQYLTSKGFPNESERFFDYYTSNGWRVGKNPMKDWEASCRNWIKNKKHEPTGGTDKIGRISKSSINRLIYGDNQPTGD